MTRAGLGWLVGIAPSSSLRGCERMNHSDVQRSDEGVNVSASVISIGSSPLRRWGLRLVGAALLTAPMLLARDAGRPLQSPPPAPSLRGTNPTPGPRTGPAVRLPRGTRRVDRTDPYGALGPGSSSTTAMPQDPSSSVAAGRAHPLGGRAPGALATAPSGSGEAFTAASLLLLLVAVMALGPTLPAFVPFLTCFASGRLEVGHPRPVGRAPRLIPPEQVPTGPRSVPAGPRLTTQSEGAN